jgi:hypothetical protein
MAYGARALWSGSPRVVVRVPLFILCGYVRLTVGDGNTVYRAIGGR